MATPDILRVARVQYLLAMARNELLQFESLPKNLGETAKTLDEIIGGFGAIYMTGPSGFDPGPTYEKCDQCKHYRLNK